MNSFDHLTLLVRCPTFMCPPGKVQWGEETERLEGRVGSVPEKGKDTPLHTLELAWPGPQPHTHLVPRLLAQQPEGNDNVTCGIDRREGG